MGSVCNLLRRVAFDRGNQLSVSVGGDDDRHTTLLCLSHQSGQVGQQQWLLSAADGQGHGDGVGAQMQGVLDVADLYLVLWTKRG